MIETMVKMRQTGKTRTRFGKVTLAAAMLAGAMTLSACNTQQVFVNGPQIDDSQLALIPVGSSRDQVLLALGTPSTTGTFDNEVFYYISQKRQRNLAYQKLKLTDQRVVAIYFDDVATVARVADYGLQDGKVFDFISRTTPTGGREVTFLQRLLTPNRSSSPTGNVPPIIGGGGTF